MARSKFKGTYRDGAGNIVPSGTVSVYLSGTTTAASIYKALAGGTAVNSVTSGTDGTFEFWVDPSDYDLDQLFKIVMSKTNYTTTTYDELDVFVFSNAIDTDGTLAANSDGYIPTQKAVKTYADTKVPKTYLDTDTSLAADSDTKIASQHATKTYADTKVPKSLYDAHTILYATTDDTPAALTVAEQRLVGRITGGNITALTSAQILTLLSLPDTTYAPWMIDINIFTTPGAQTNWSTIGNSSTNFIWGTLTSAGTQNDAISWPVVLSAGTWTFTLIHVKDTDRGIYTVAIDGVSIGTIDGYNGSATYNNIATITGIAVATAGKKTLSITMATKNGSASAYKGCLESVNLIRTA